MLETLVVTRVVTTPEAMAGLCVPSGSIVLQTSPDEALVIDARAEQVNVPDAHAIVVDDAGWCGAWLSTEETAELLRRGAEWLPPASRPSLAQGMLFQLPAKLWLEPHRALLVTPRTVATELAERIGTGK